MQPKPVWIRRLTLAAALSAFPALAAAQGQLGTYAGCSIYACHQFTLSEFDRSGPVVPAPGSELEYPQNVLSYFVRYRLAGSTTFLPLAFAHGVTELSTGFETWAFRDGFRGDWASTIFLSRSLVGRVAGESVAWAFTPEAPGLFGLSGLVGYLPVEWPAGSAAVSFTREMFEQAITSEQSLGVFAFRVERVAVTATPEPATLALVGVGALLVGAAARRRRA